MLQQGAPDDFVIATGDSHTVREFLEVAFELTGLEVERYVRFDAHYLRPAEVDHLLGDASKAHAALGWRPRTTFPELVRIMLEADLLDAGLDPARCLARASSPQARAA